MLLDSNKKSISNKYLYIVSGSLVTIGMLVIKGVATVINLTVAFLLP